ncbi:response regulator transcription factor [Candidatus Arthromitus sp. SFB-rat-Yit]|uniref:response regulator transcription factor n=1 Tax=Candidatus Arthromitus sp. SFB-rat-Yit TaxID=1041504 RepID=UPI000227A402|nr:response regulator transcription factor [Candidatus Arthromitus sp. SFB-rat-Yit]BAK81506.1 two component transcriptional regulator, winged helix family [Candidatus Arthromitus sp. SFB-rat-Yit]
MYRLLIVEDDFRIAEAIKEKMKMWDLDLYVIEDFRMVLTDFKSYNPHIVLLDISLPFFDGYHWCREIRKISNIPIIFISSASDNMNIVMAMNMGADDFIAKPFDMNVLVAKVQAMLRRAYDFIQSVSVLEHRGAFLNMEDDTLTFNNNKIALTKNEYRILLCLMENKGKVVSREKIMERLWKTESFIDENTLTVNVNRLRKKLDSSGLENFITTRVGVGYIVE